MAPYLAGAAPADHPNKRKTGACRGPRLNLLTIVDRAALAAYCQAWGRWVEAEANIQRFGAVIKTPKGLPLVNPYLRIAERAIDQMRKFLVEFGMANRYLLTVLIANCCFPIISGTVTNSYPSAL